MISFRVKFAEAIRARGSLARHIPTRYEFIRRSRRVCASHLFIIFSLNLHCFSSLEEQQLSKPNLPHPHLLSKRQIAAMSPRLGILNNIPLAISFEVRVFIFHHFVMNDMMSRGTKRGFRGIMDFGGLNGKARVQVRRGIVAQDGFDKLAEVDLQAPIVISFMYQFGQEECVSFHLFFLLFFRLSDLCVYFRERVSVEAVCSMDSLCHCVRRSSTPIGGSGWRT